VACAPPRLVRSAWKSLPPRRGSAQAPVLGGLRT
jgi:hypothetical protein